METAAINQVKQSLKNQAVSSKNLILEAVQTTTFKIDMETAQNQIQLVPNHDARENWALWAGTFVDDGDVRKYNPGMCWDLCNDYVKAFAKAQACRGDQKKYDMWRNSQEGKVYPEWEILQSYGAMTISVNENSQLFHAKLGQGAKGGSIIAYMSNKDNEVKSITINNRILFERVFGFNFDDFAILDPEKGNPVYYEYVHTTKNAPKPMVEQKPRWTIDLSTGKRVLETVEIQEKNAKLREAAEAKVKAELAAKEKETKAAEVAKAKADKEAEAKAAKEAKKLSDEAAKKTKEKTIELSELKDALTDVPAEAEVK